MISSTWARPSRSDPVPSRRTDPARTGPYPRAPGGADVPRWTRHPAADPPWWPERGACGPRTPAALGYGDRPRAPPRPRDRARSSRRAGRRTWRRLSRMADSLKRSDDRGAPDLTGAAPGGSAPDPTAQPAHGAGPHRVRTVPAAKIGRAHV